MARADVDGLSALLWTSPERDCHSETVAGGHHYPSVPLEVCRAQGRDFPCSGLWRIARQCCLVSMAVLGRGILTGTHAQVEPTILRPQGLVNTRFPQAQLNEAYSPIFWLLPFSFPSLVDTPFNFHPWALLMAFAQLERWTVNASFLPNLNRCILGTPQGLFSKAFGSTPLWPQKHCEPSSGANWEAVRWVERTWN